MAHVYGSTVERWDEALRLLKAYPMTRTQLAVAIDVILRHVSRMINLMRAEGYHLTRDEAARWSIK